MQRGCWPHRHLSLTPFTYVSSLSWGITYWPHPTPPFPPSDLTPFPPPSFLTCTIYTTACMDKERMFGRLKWEWLNIYVFNTFWTAFLPYVWHWLRMIIRSYFWEKKFVNNVLYRRLNFGHNVRIFRLKLAWKSWMGLAIATTASTSQNVCIHINLQTSPHWSALEYH